MKETKSGAVGETKENKGKERIEKSEISCKKRERVTKELKK